MNILTFSLPRCLTAPIFVLLATFATTVQAAIDASLVAASPDQTEIRMTDGSVLLGAIKGIRNNALTVTTAFSKQDLKISLDHVEALNRSGATELLLADGRTLRLLGLKVASGQIDLDGDTVSLTSVKIMNPKGWEKGDGYHWSGDTSTAIAYTRGNTKTDQLDVALNTVLKSAEDRVTVNANFQRDDAYRFSEENGEQVQKKVVTADDWKVLGKYDYFLEGSENYLGANVSVEANALAGVSLRTYVGPYYGRRLFDNPRLSLDGEVGLALVSTDYAEDVDQEDNDYTGLNWNLTGESGILGGDSKLYLRHVGIVELEDSEQLILKTTAGLSFPLLYGLQAAAELTVNYDGTAAQDRAKVDEIYRLRVGYAW